MCVGSVHGAQQLGSWELVSAMGGWGGGLNMGVRLGEHGTIVGRRAEQANA